MLATERPRATIYNLGPLSAIPIGEGRAFQLGPLAVAVFRSRSGGVYATQAACPHRGGPLADGMIGGERLICPLHAYAFDLRSGQPSAGACAALRVYPVSVSAAGDIVLDLTDQG